MAFLLKMLKEDYLNLDFTLSSFTFTCSSAFVKGFTTGFGLETAFLIPPLATAARESAVKIALKESAVAFSAAIIASFAACSAAARESVVNCRAATVAKESAVTLAFAANSASVGPQAVKIAAPIIHDKEKISFFIVKFFCKSSYFKQSTKLFFKIIKLLLHKLIKTKKMKIKPIYLFALGAVLALNACKDDDLSAPSLSLNGSSSVTSRYGVAYEDAGAVASDDVDGDITSKIITSGEPDGFSAGAYTITYDVSDDAGNAAATITRDVVISLDGLYSVAEVCSNGSFSYNITTADSTGGATYIIFSNFADVFSDKVYGTVVGNSLTIALQEPIEGSDISVSGSGTISLGANNAIVMTISYEIINTETTTCEMVATQP
jgi:Domain of unknown function (DUF5011)